MDRVLTIPEAADFLRCSPNSLSDPAWRRSVGLPAVRIGRSVRFLESDLVRFLRGQREITQPPRRHAPTLGDGVGA